MSLQVQTALMTEDERRAHAKRALNTFKTMISAVYQPLLRAVTGKPRLKVLPHSTMSATDNKTVWLKVPWVLGETREHDRPLCNKRDPETLEMLCPACQVRDSIDRVVFHESAHITSESFEEVDAEQVRKIGLATCPGIKDLDTMKLVSFYRGLPMNTQGVCNQIEKVYLPRINNAVEDIYVNRRLFAHRPGTEPCLQVGTIETFTHGFDEADGTHHNWGEAPLSHQAIMATYLLGCRLPRMIDNLDPAMQVIKEDEVLNFEMESIPHKIDAYGRVEIAFRVLARLRELGYCIPKSQLPKPAPEPEEEPEPEDEPDETEVAEPSDDDDQDDAEPQESDDEPEEGESCDEGDESPTPEGEDGDSEADAGDGEAGDADEEAQTDGDGGSEESDEKSDDYDDPDASGGDDDSEAPDADDNDAEGSDDDDDASGQGEGDDESQDETDPQPGGASDDADDDDESEDDSEGAGTGGQGSEADDDDDQDDDADDEGGYDDAPDFGDDDDDAASDDDDDQDLPSGSGEPDEGDDESGQDDDGYTPEEIEAMDEEEAAEVDKFVRQMMGHDDEDDSPAQDPEDGFRPPPDPNEGEIADELDKAIKWEKFDAPPEGIGDFFEQEIDITSSDAKNWDDIVVDPGLITGETARLRAVFAQNRKANMERNLRRGPRLDTPHLARIGMDDFRIFGRRSIPHKRDWFVLVGLDDSGSTHWNGAAPFLREMAVAVGEMLNGCGVKFAIYGHGGVDGASRKTKYGVNYTDPEGGSWKVRHLVIKDPAEPWTDECKARANAMGRDETCNYDGHSLEQYRKILASRSETDKMLLYFTDGEMPCMNYAEEEVILKREIGILRAMRANLVGVGYQTDSPSRHGMDTIRVQGTDDLASLIDGLRVRLSA